MSKTTVKKPPYTKRVGIPRIVKDPKSGNALLLCPFCNPSHPLQPNVPSKCGTMLILTAEQTVIRAKYDKKFVCVKCGKGGGEMVVFQNGFIHINDCAPNVIAMTEPPKYSKMASSVFHMKEGKLKKFVESITGRAAQVEEVTPDGTRTGVIFGYYFNKVKHAKRSTTGS